MGADQSNIRLNIPENFEHFSLMFCGNNKLRLLLAPNSIVNATKDVLNIAWPIRSINEGTGYTEFNLGKRPFNGSYKDETDFQYLMCALFRDYYKLGWHFQFSTQLQRRRCKSSTIIFEKKNLISTYIMAISLYNNNLIKIMGPNDIFNLLKTVVVAHWPKGIKRERQMGQFFELKLRFDPWSAQEPQTYFSVSMMNTVMKTLYNNGWVNIGAVKIGKRRTDLNALYFRFDRDLREKNLAGIQNNFFAMSLNKSDKIRIVNASLEIINWIRTGIDVNWPKGIVSEKIRYDSYEFTLRGDPFWCDGLETVESRMIISGILSNLKQKSWSIYSTCLLNKSLSSKSVFFFRENPNTDPTESKFTCISLNGNDKLRVINGNSFSLIAVSDAIQSCWRHGLINQNYYGKSWQFQLKNKPFRGDYNDLISIAAIIMSLIYNLKKTNLYLVASVFVSGKHSIFADNSYSKGLSSFYFTSRI